MRTRPICSPALNSTPRNDSVSLPCAGSAKNVPSELLPVPKNSRLVTDGRSTSVNTAPKAETVAGVAEPGTKKATSVTLLPVAVNSRWALKGSNSVG